MSVSERISEVYESELKDDDDGLSSLQFLLSRLEFSLFRPTGRNLGTAREVANMAQCLELLP